LHWKIVDSLEHPKTEGWDVVPYEYFYENFDLVGKGYAAWSLRRRRKIYGFTGESSGRRSNYASY